MISTQSLLRSGANCKPLHRTHSRPQSRRLPPDERPANRACCELPASTAARPDRHTTPGPECSSPFGCNPAGQPPRHPAASKALRMSTARAADRYHLRSEAGWLEKDPKLAECPLTRRARPWRGGPELQEVHTCAIPLLDHAPAGGSASPAIGVDVDVDDYACGLSVPAPRSHPVPQAPGPASALPCLLLDGPRPVVRNRPQDEWAPAQVPRFPGSPSVG